MGSENQYPITSGAILYPFDGNTRDASLLANGSPVGAFLLLSYNCGAYSGSVILLNATQHFTLEVWVLPINAATNSGLQDDFPIFGQCDGYLTCLLLTFRSGRIQLSFNSMATNVTLTSSTLIPYWNWIHVAVVYDITIYQQLIYINGIIYTVSEGIVTPFQSSSSLASTTIGRQHHRFLFFYSEYD
ncbi:unnamed protein product [Rotaria socialis]|uniref:LamG domain-containing protein n=1 Tax=Rotaria socialis TaxID=392032 RepID=A0A820MXD5_9BILA|nr:unnamed protein product [Rotaria socialis]CAF4380270.1 unnamed protein product [Rotaria socialis]